MSRAGIALGGHLNPEPLHFAGVALEARELVIGDVLADLTTNQRLELEAHPALLAVRCEAHLRNTLPELLVLTQRERRRLTALVQAQAA